MIALRKICWLPLGQHLHLLQKFALGVCKEAQVVYSLKMSDLRYLGLKHHLDGLKNTRQANFASKFKIWIPKHKDWKEVINHKLVRTYAVEMESLRPRLLRPLASDVDSTLVLGYINQGRISHSIIVHPYDEPPKQISFVIGSKFESSEHMKLPQKNAALLFGEGNVVQLWCIDLNGAKNLKSFQLSNGHKEKNLKDLRLFTACFAKSSLKSVHFWYTGDSDWMISCIEDVFAPLKVSTKRVNAIDDHSWEDCVTTSPESFTCFNISQELTCLAQFMSHYETDGWMTTNGVERTVAALEAKAVETLLIDEKCTAVRRTYQHNQDPGEVRTFIRRADNEEADIPPAERLLYSLKEERLFIEWLFEEGPYQTYKVVVTSGKSRFGLRFANDLGGFGSILRYSYSF